MLVFIQLNNSMKRAKQLLKPGTTSKYPKVTNANDMISELFSIQI